MWRPQKREEKSGVWFAYGVADDFEGIIERRKIVLCHLHDAKAQRLQTIAQANGVLLNQDEIRLERGDRFQVWFGIRADFRLLLRLGRITAIRGDPNDTIAKPERVEHLRDAGRGGDDALRLPEPGNRGKKQKKDDA
jgi:hypothetical protein